MAINELNYNIEDNKCENFKNYNLEILSLRNSNNIIYCIPIMNIGTFRIEFTSIIDYTKLTVVLNLDGEIVINYNREKKKKTNSDVSVSSTGQNKRARVKGMLLR